MQFSYQLIDNMDIKEIALIYSGSTFGLILIAGLIVILISRTCVSKVIKNNQESWSKMAIEMSKVMASANKPPINNNNVT